MPGTARSKASALHALVFVLLALAAFLTAFYTMRQLGLTFWGDARTEEAKHANLGHGIVAVTMTLPLIVLAFFAVVAGFVGVHPDFPIFGAIFSPNGNPFEHFVGATLLHEPEAHRLQHLPGAGLVRGVAGRAVRSATCCTGASRWSRAKPDPLVAILGRFPHDAQEQILLRRTVRQRSSSRRRSGSPRTVAYEFIDKGIIDGFLT